jgi:uncharacterized protein YdeI (YjbR/CyaY-like superfamily)
MTPLRVTTRAQWRKWLERHHDRETEAWIVYKRAHTGPRQLTYADAVEEAICFGWIDTTVHPIDDDHYMQLFTPRRNLRNWSKINLDRFAKMEAAGLMTDAGRAKKPHDVTPPPPRVQSGDPVPSFIAEALERHPKAKEVFEKLAPSYRRNYIRYIVEAKQEATRARRMEQMIVKLKAGDKNAF